MAGTPGTAQVLQPNQRPMSINIAAERGHVQNLTCKTLYNFIRMAIFIILFILLMYLFYKAYQSYWEITKPLRQLFAKW